MKLQFDTVEEQVIPQMRGGEGAACLRMYTDAHNKIMRGRLEPGCSIGLHTHDTNSEIIYVLTGRGKMLFDGGEERLEMGDCHYCPMGHAHSLINDSDQPLTFFAVVPQHPQTGAAVN